MMMNYLQSILRNGVTLTVIAALVVVTLWLVWSQRSVPQPMAAQTTETPQSTIIPSTTLTNPPPPRPTTTPTNPNVEYTPPSVGVVVTLISPPTPAPSPTSTPTFEPLSDKPIGGYVFGTPELLLTDNYMEIVDWLPNSNKELIVRNIENERELVEILNIKNGRHQRIVETSQAIVGKPVWLSTTKQIAYLAWDKTGSIINLYFNGLDKQNVSNPVLRDVSPPLVPASSGTDALVFDKTMSQLLNTNQMQRKQNIGGLELGKSLPNNVEGGPFASYQAAWNNKTNWIAYYNPEMFVLIDSKTGKTRNIDLGNKPDTSEKLWATYAAWSSDGQKLALIVTSGVTSPPLAFTQLAVLDPSTENINLIEDNFIYVSDLAWSPDNTHVLIKSILGTFKGYDVHALFLVDVLSHNIIPVPVIPKNALGSSYNGLFWSSDGTEIVVRYAENPDEVGWYRVSVTKP